MVLCIANLVLFYDIIYNSIDIELTDLCNTKSYGHSLNIMKQHWHCGINATLHSFAYQNVSAWWNSLPENVVHCKYSTFNSIDRIDFL